MPVHESKTERPKPKVEYETVTLRELVVGFRSGPITTLLWPEDTLTFADPDGRDNWYMQIRCQKVNTLVTVPDRPEYWSLREFPGQRARSQYSPSPEEPPRSTATGDALSLGISQPVVSTDTPSHGSD
jgi:hypothetical protein